MLIIPILIFIVPLLDSNIVIDWKSFFCRSDLPVATRRSLLQVVLSKWHFIY